MKTPGIEVRPIQQMSGGADFNEVFFTDVRVPDSQRLGGSATAGRSALTTLMNERLAVGGPSGGLDGSSWSWRATPGSTAGRRSRTSRCARSSPTGTCQPRG